MCYEYRVSSIEYREKRANLMSKFNVSSIGLDIGSRYIKFVELKKIGDSIILSKFGIKEIPQDIKLDKDKVIMQVISGLFSENKIKPRYVNISMSGQAVFIRFVKLLQVKEDKLIKTMKFEAQNQIPFPLNEVLWDWSLLDKDKLLTKKAVIVAIKKNLVEEIVARLKDIKLTTELIDVSPISAYNCMVFNEDYDVEKLGAILDIGARSTNFIIFHKGNIWIRTFPIAGDRVREIRDEGLEELALEIERSLEYYFMQGGEEGEAPNKKKLDELFLTGGGSILEDIETIFIDRFSVKPKVLDPFKRLRIPKELFSNIDKAGIKNQFTTAVGLALRGIAPLAIEVNFLKETILEKNLGAKKRIYRSLSIAMLVLILASLSIFMRQDYYVKKLKLDKINEMVDIYETYEPKIKKIQGMEDILKEKINILYQVSSSRGIWLDVFKVIIDILPKDVWVTDVSGAVSIEKTGLGRLDLNGRAFSYQSVNNFVAALKSSPNFKDVKPISSSVEKDKDTQEEIVKFSITMDVVVGGSGSQNAENK